MTVLRQCSVHIKAEVKIKSKLVGYIWHLLLNWYMESNVILSLQISDNGFDNHFSRR